MSDLLKRTMDILVSASLLVVTTPLWVVIAVAIRIESRGPVFYRAVRMGRNSESFAMHKFRTMRHAPDEQGPAITAGGDLRVTRVGSVLRRTKLDELPQLFDVLVGTMSLVGPRPEDPKYLPLYDDDTLRVLSMKPGISGPTAIAFRQEESLLAAVDDPEREYIERILPKKLQMDLQYVDDHSIGGDIKIMLETVKALFQRAAA